MIPEDFHRRFCIRIISRLELDISNSDFIEKILNKIFQLRKTKSMSNNQSFYLMKLCQMSRV
jgi:hypothetical protein